MLKVPFENKALTADELTRVFQGVDVPTCFLVNTRDGWIMVDTERPETFESQGVREALRLLVEKAGL